MTILQTLVPTPLPPANLSSLRILSSASNILNLTSRISQLSLQSPPFPTIVTTIHMSGGPQKYPGGLNKYQWRRVKSVKAKKLHKAGVRREPQIYQMRKRGELRMAVSELERPWEAFKGEPRAVSVREDGRGLNFLCSFSDSEESAYGSESDSEQEGGHGDLVRIDKQVVEGTCWKNSRFCSREEKIGDVQEPDYLERIQISGDEKDFRRGSLRNKGKLDSEKIKRNEEEINEITSSAQRGRYGPNAREHNRGRVSRKLKLSHSGEVLNFKWDGAYKSRPNRER